MSFNHFIPNPTKEIVKQQYQPIFPLVYDSSFGPYKPITSIEESIQKDFEYLLLTNPGEWPMNPDLGIGIKRYLFENYKSPELSKIQERVRNQLAKYLPFPYVQLNSVEFLASPEDQDSGYINLRIRYTILSNSIRTMEILKGGKLIKMLPPNSNVNYNSFIQGEHREELKSVISNMRNI